MAMPSKPRLRRQGFPRGVGYFHRSEALLRMPARVCCALAALLELLQCVAARRFEKPIICEIAADVCGVERLPYQLGDAFDYFGGICPLICGDANRRFQGKAAPEDSKPPK